MIDLTLPLIGPAVTVLAALRKLGQKHDRLAILLWGEPGNAKSHVLDLLALELAGSQFAIEQINGQSLSVDVVREWRDRSVYGNLFSQWTIKRIDEFDCASPAARNEVLTLLDYLKPNQAILASTNDYAALRAAGNRRLESRLKCFEVQGPSPTEAVAYLRQHFKIPAKIATAIVQGAVPDGVLSGIEGVNMRLCVEDAQSYLAVRAAA